MFIRSERLFLRPAWPEDWEELLPLIADEGVAHNLARVPWPYTADDAREFTARGADRKLPNFIVTLPGCDGSRIVGCAGLNLYEGQPELGYWMAREHWGKGYATEAARAVLRLAGALGHRRIFAGHFADNPASGKVLRKVGFQPTGRVRQRYCLARGSHVRSIEHAVELPAMCGGEGGDGETPIGRMAA